MPSTALTHIIGWVVAWARIGDSDDDSLRRIVASALPVDGVAVAISERHVYASHLVTTTT